ncbi:uncharacterized protein TrAtP1_004120 [Trichoderma atroviride]|uniref:uncharacterized protein n=1 Tax=Hypocrea atroviridis TaxID=63577 RepID=UPI00332D1072|nr:hypothetical protein TrAtP1_004120 [Trichoderma atroviride]
MIVREASSVTVSAESSSQMCRSSTQANRGRAEIKKRCVVTLKVVWGRDVIGPRPFPGPLLQTA